MRNKFNPTVATLGLVSVVFILLLTAGCIPKPCSSSIEVKAIDPEPDGSYHHYRSDKTKIKTWDPVWKFPRNPNKDVTGYVLEPFRPYLARVEVTNESDVEVRGVTVVFYASAFGLFDYSSTPFGAVAADIPAESTVWVNCPWFFMLPEEETKHLCVTYRIFHPCDTILENNWCSRNLVIYVVPQLFVYHVTPFVVDFVEFDGAVTLETEIEKEGISAEVVRGDLIEGPAETAPKAETLREMKVKPGEPEDLYLVIKNEGAKLKPGETFDVTVKAMAEKRVISEFTVQYEVGEETGEKREEEEPAPEKGE